MEHEEGEGPKWVTHYSSDHQILLVGDGDFSFSLSLAKAFGAASNIVASSLDSYDVVTKRYKFAKPNLDELQKLGACLLHEVDATKMRLHSDLKMRRFDRIIFNFPHAGFHGNEDNTLMIKKHKDLVLGFFKNASCMLRANGEVHVNHKTSAPFSNWNIEKLASQCFLTLSECAEFKKEDYTGYNNKRGDGTRCDEPFPLGKCGTFKFVYNPKAISKHKRRKQVVDSRQQTNIPFQETQYYMEQSPTSIYRSHPQRSGIPIMNQAHTSFHLNHYPQPSIPKMNGALSSLHLNHYPQTSYIPNMNEAPTSLHLNHYPQASHIPKEAVTSTFGWENEYPPISRGYLNNVEELHGRATPPSSYYASSCTSRGSYLMERWAELRRKSAEQKEDINPRIKAKLKNEKLCTRKWITRFAGQNEFEVHHVHNPQVWFVVNLNNKDCTCRRWQLTGIPCRHAISAMNHVILNPEDFIPQYYKKEAYMAVYRHVIHPAIRPNMWEVTPCMDVLPPPIRRQPGRPKKARNKEAGEIERDPNSVSKKGLKQKCRIYGISGHNKKTCPQAPPTETEPAPKAAPQTQPAPEAAPQSQPVRGKRIKQTVRGKRIKQTVRGKRIKQTVRLHASQPAKPTTEAPPPQAPTPQSQPVRDKRIKQTVRLVDSPLQPIQHQAPPTPQVALQPPPQAPRQKLPTRRAAPQAPPRKAPPQAPPKKAPTQAPPKKAPTQAPPKKAPTQAPPEAKRKSPRKKPMQATRKSPRKASMQAPPEASQAPKKKKT